MANQIEVTVYEINGMPQTDAFVMSFLTSDIMVQEYDDPINASINSSLTYYPVTNDKQKTQVFLVGETVNDILAAANDGGTTQVQATVYSENESPYKEPKKTNFPANGISVWPVANSLPVQSFIEYKNNKYQVSESETTLLADSNTVYSTYKVYTALLTQLGVSHVYSTQSAPLTVGVTYMIYDSIAGDDFRNVGGPLIVNNNDFNNTYFVATGTTPTNWIGETPLSYDTGAPVVNVLENTIGNIWWTYVSEGNWSANSNGLFTAGKCYIDSKNIFGGANSVNLWESTETSAVPNQLSFYYADYAGTFYNGMDLGRVEIRVYP